jgi:hypothetical protein
MRHFVFLDVLVAEVANATPWVVAFGFGLGLFLGCQKLFEGLEKSLNAQTKLEIAVWVLDLKPTKSIQRWRSTFFSMFTKVFGEKHW